MHKSRRPYPHFLLGWVQAFDCSGNKSNRHPRRNVRVDLQGRLWDVDGWPPRQTLAPFERKRVKEILEELTEPQKDRLLACLQRCTRSLDSTKSGCGGFLRYNSKVSSTNAAARKLHQFVCPKSKRECDLGWTYRRFDDKGKEVRVAQRGGARPVRRDISIPTGARLCPVCKSRLNSFTEVSLVAGKTYSPPLLRCICPNPNNVNHRGVGRSRKGLTFYYNRKRSWFETVYPRSRKQRGPAFTRDCNKCGRVNRKTVLWDRLPAGVRHEVIRKGLDPEAASYHCDYCLCRETWLTDDGKLLLERSNPRKKSTPFRSFRPAA
jgi:hypothetical protein